MRYSSSPANELDHRHMTTPSLSSIQFCLVPFFSLFLSFSVISFLTFISPSKKILTYPFEETIRCKENGKIYLTNVEINLFWEKIDRNTLTSSRSIISYIRLEEVHPSKSVRGIKKWSLQIDSKMAERRASGGSRRGEERSSFIQVQNIRWA